MYLTYRMCEPLSPNNSILHISPISILTEFFESSCKISVFSSTKCCIFHSVNFLVHKTFTFYLKDALKLRFTNLLHKVNRVPTDQKGARLANILDHQTASILTEVCRGNVLLLCLHSVHATEQKSIPFWASSSAAGSEASGSSSGFLLTLFSVYQ